MLLRVPDHQLLDRLEGYALVCYFELPGNRGQVGDFLLLNPAVLLEELLLLCC